MITPLEERLSGYFYYFGARAAFGRAIALADTPAQAAHIRRHLDGLMRTA
jgi:RNA polymerase sigma-70 factor (ECF subfamily)